MVAYSAILLMVGASLTAGLMLRTRAWRSPTTFLLALLPLAFVAVGGRMAQTLLDAANFDWAGARLAPLIGMKFGHSLYQGPDSGPVLNTIYAPLSYLIYFPALLATNAVSAITIASVVGLLAFFVPPLLVLLKKPVSPDVRGSDCQVSAYGFLFSVAGHPEATNVHEYPGRPKPVTHISQRNREEESVLPTHRNSVKSRIYNLIGFVLFALLAYQAPSLRMSIEGTSHDSPALGFACLACLFLYGERGRRFRERLGCGNPPPQPVTYGAPTRGEGEESAIAPSPLMGEGWGGGGRPHSRLAQGHLVASSVCLALAIWSKQVMFPLALALPLWTLARHGWRHCLRHAVVLSLSGLLVSLPFLLAFPLREMFFNIWRVPASHPWNGQPPVNLAATAFYFYRDAFLLIAALVLIGFHEGLGTARKLVLDFWGGGTGVSPVQDRRDAGPTAGEFEPLFPRSALPARWGALRDWLSQHPWSLFVLVGVCNAPTAFLGRIKLGGSANSFSPTTYFLLLAILSYAVRAIVAGRRGERLLFTVATTAVVLLVAGQQMFFFKDYQGLPETKEACVTRYLQRHPGTAYFPWNSLAHLYVDGKLCHFAYGLFDREIAGHAIADEHFLRHVPADCQLVCFPPGRRQHRPPQCLDKFMQCFPRRVEVPELPGFECYERGKSTDEPRMHLVVDQQWD